MTENEIETQSHGFVYRFVRLREKYSEAFWNYFGEFFREAAVLVAVFGLLEQNRNSPGRAGAYITTIAVITASCFLFGLRCWRNAQRAKTRAERARKEMLAGDALATEGEEST